MQKKRVACLMSLNEAQWCHPNILWHPKICCLICSCTIPIPKLQSLRSTYYFRSPLISSFSDLCLICWALLPCRNALLLKIDIGWLMSLSLTVEPKASTLQKLKTNGTALDKITVSAGVLIFTCFYKRDAEEASDMMFHISECETQQETQDDDEVESISLSMPTLLMQSFQLKLPAYFLTLHITAAYKLMADIGAAVNGCSQTDAPQKMHPLWDLWHYCSGAFWETDVSFSIPICPLHHKKTWCQQGQFVRWLANFNLDLGIQVLSHFILAIQGNISQLSWFSSCKCDLGWWGCGFVWPKFISEFCMWPSLDFTHTHFTHSGIGYEYPSRD